MLYDTSAAKEAPKLDILAKIHYVHLNSALDIQLKTAFWDCLFHGVETQNLASNY